MNKRGVIYLLLVIMLLAGGLRFFGLTHRGLFYADETRYYRYAVAIKESITRLNEGLACKPGHELLGLIGLYLLGSHQYSVLFISGLLGVATVFMVFLIGCKFYDLKVGILSALFLAVCAAHVLFSRSFLAHGNQAFFLVLAAYLYLSNFKMLSSLCLGYSFLVHPTGIIYLGPFLLCEFFLWLRKRQGFIRVFWFMVFFIAPFVALEGVSIFARKESGSILVNIYKGYLGQILFVNAEAANLGVETNKNLGPFHYFIMSWLTNGPVFTAVLTISVVFYSGYFLIKRQLSKLMIGVFSIALFGYWQFLSIHERLFREIIILFPFFCIIMGVFISKLHRKFAALLICILALEGLWNSAKIIPLVRSDYPKMEKFFIDNKVNKIITPSIYLATTSDVLMPHLSGMEFYIAGNMDEAKELGNKEKADYVIIYPEAWLDGEKFRFTSPPLLRVAEPNFIYFPSFYETAKIQNKMEYLQYRHNPDAVSVAIYDLRKEPR